jgi:hypothetical protein
MSGKFYQYPDPLEGPNVPYKNEAVSNPALRGKLLQIGASMYVFSSVYCPLSLFRIAFVSNSMLVTLYANGDSQWLS